MINAFAHVVDGWLRAELLLKGTVIHERLVEQYGFTGNYQRVKLYLQQARPRIAAELGIDPAVATVRIGNLASQHVLEAAGARMVMADERRLYFNLPTGRRTAD